MKSTSRFSNEVLETLQKGRILGIHAGTDSTHRVIGIWVVVVERRVFIRSWSLKPRSWWRTFLEDPQGTINVEGTEYPVRAVRTRSERLKDLVSKAYRAKYHTPGSVQYARDLGRAKSRETTTELAPTPLKGAGQADDPAEKRGAGG